MRTPNETWQTMVVHGKIWLTYMVRYGGLAWGCIVVYGGHAPIPNKWEFEFEMGTRFQMEPEFKFEL